MAEADARNTWGKFAAQDCPLLSAHVLEGEHCWFFFRNPTTEVPSAAWYAAGWAYAISRRGQVRSIADLSAEPDKQRAYLELMSAHFAHIELGGPKPDLPEWVTRPHSSTKEGQLWVDRKS
ncbi:hypothetical protein [Brevundimonas sp. Root1279]|uniref:hypothetical protein n=1 Tax=Brevundimonas sp. Root1279 TaxID=1736443 RepID=UPI0012E37727|nr:hypothetical protein [Brevundimonas sp. Root1279]